MRLRTGSYLLLAAAAIFNTGCESSPASPTATAPSSVAQTSTAGAASGSISIAGKPIANLPATGVLRDGSGDFVKSDAAGAYVDGSQGVSSAIEAQGTNYVLDTNSSGPARRWLSISSPASTGCALGVTGTVYGRLTGVDQGTAGLTGMTVGSSKNTNLAIALGTSSKSSLWRLNFGAKYGTSYVVATRVSITQWTLEALNATAKIVDPNGNACGDASGLNFLVTVTTN